MTSVRSIIVYSIVGICIFFASIYSMYIFGMNTSLFFADSDVFFPFMNKVNLPYSAWLLPSHIVLIPDSLLFSIISAFTSTSKEAIVIYAIVITCCIYVIILLVVQKNLYGTPLPLYFAIWAMLLVLYFGSTPFSAQIFMPNGLLGFAIFFVIAMRCIHAILYTRYSKISESILFITLFIAGFISPVLTFVFLGIPAIGLPYIQKRFEFNTMAGKNLYFDCIVSISIIAGFIAQMYFISPTYTLETLSLTKGVKQYIEYTHFSLILFSCIGIIYSFANSFTSYKKGIAVTISRSISLGIIAGLFAVLGGILDAQLYLLFIMFFSIVYAIPQCVIAIISLITMSNQKSAHIVYTMSTLIVVSILYWSYTVPKKYIQSKALLEHIEKRSITTDMPYIMAPKGIAGELTVFSNQSLIAVPYIPDTLNFSTFTPQGNEEHIYSSFILHKNYIHTLLMEQFIRLIGKPSTTTEIGDYIVLDYNNGFIMPSSATLATYTTPLGNTLRSALIDAKNIDIPENFVINGIPTKEIKLVEIEGKRFIVLIFDKGISLPKEAQYIAYTLSPSSSSIRKLASGIRREFPIVSSLLPMEDANKKDSANEEGMYLLSNGDTILPINITENTEESLLFLSISINGAIPTIIIQYPTPPLPLTKE